MAKNEWQNDDSDFHPALCIWTILFPYFLDNLFKQKQVVLQVINIWKSQ